MLNRTPEKQIFPYCQENNIGVIVRGPLAMGILTGKFGAETEFEKGDWRSRWQENPEERDIFLNDLEKVEKLKPLARGRALAQLALQFVMAHPAVSTVIPGAKTFEQVEENVQAGLLPPLTDGELAQIDAITPPGGGRKVWPA
jgi:aryl-alcohol dehydrogenase-like predicted oxidoreductase